MRKKALLAPVLVALALGFAACGSSDDDSTESTATETTTESSGDTTESGSTPAPSGEARKSEKVEIVEFTYGPDPVTVQAGGKVIWQNQDSAPHTATADDGSFDTGTLAKGKTGSETFKEVGSYPYFCEIHPTMRGTVEVVE